MFRGLILAHAEGIQGPLPLPITRWPVPGSPQEKVRAALGLFSEPSVAGAFMEQAFALYLRHDEIVPTQVRHAIRELGRVWQYRELDPIASDWGRRQIYF